LPPTPPNPAATGSNLFPPKPAATGSGLFGELGYTVIRINAIVPRIDWFRPYAPPQHAEYVGSGFAVVAGLRDDSDPVFLTNAHVVKNADLVQVQVPAVGQERFEAYVPLICDTFDLAVVRLTKPEKLRAALEAKKAMLRPLDVRREPLSLGLEVAAVGFPLGTNSLKVSRGIISGTERVQRMTSYQSTAPISPGNSGGPLFAIDTGKLQLIGLNFAASSSGEAQNVNYVVPTVNVLQVLAELREQTSTWKPGDKGHPPHKQLDIAPINTVIVEANDALYAAHGCKSGAFISEIQPTSVLRVASPPVPDQSFLVSVNDIPVDKYGKGRTEEFLGDPIPIQSLTLLKDTLKEKVTIKICKEGNETQHEVSLLWKPKVEVQIQEILEPVFTPEDVDFETFAGLTIMQLTMNHLDTLIRKGEYTLGRWLCPENALQPRLAVVHVDPGTYAARVLRPGMIIKSVNGHDVFRLEDVRKYFTPSQGNSSADTVTAAVPWQLMTDRNITFAVNFTEALVKQLLKVRMGRYPLTEMVANATVEAGLFPHSKGTSSGKNPVVLRRPSHTAGHGPHGVKTLSQKLGDLGQAVEVRIAQTHAQAASRAQFTQPGPGI